MPPTVVQSVHTPPADPQVMSDGDWQLPLVSQQPTHVWAHERASPAVASAIDPSSPVLLVSPWPCASAAPSSPVAVSGVPGEYVESVAVDASSPPGIVPCEPASAPNGCGKSSA